MKSYKRCSRQALALVLGALSSGCLNANAGERMQMQFQNALEAENKPKKKSSLPLFKLLLGTAVVVGAGKFAYDKIGDVIRHKLYEGSKELKGINLTNVLLGALRSWYCDKYETNEKLDRLCVQCTYLESDDRKKCITVYDITLHPDKKPDKNDKDLIVFGPNCYSSVLLFNPEMLEVYDHVYLVERSGYGMAENNIDVPNDMDGLYEGARYFANEVLPKNQNRKRELLCFSMGGAEVSELMKMDEFKDFTLISPVCIRTYLGNSLLYKVLSFIYSEFDASWATNMINAVNVRNEKMTVNVMSGDETDKLCAVNSLMAAAEKELGWKKPQVWDSLNIHEKANELSRFYMYNSDGKLIMNVTIFERVDHPGNALMYQYLQQLGKTPNQTPGGAAPKAKEITFLNYLINAFSFFHPEVAESLGEMLSNLEKITPELV